MLFFLCCFFSRRAHLAGVVHVVCSLDLLAPPRLALPLPRGRHRCRGPDVLAGPHILGPWNCTSHRSKSSSVPDLICWLKESQSLSSSKVPTHGLEPAGWFFVARRSFASRATLSSIAAPTCWVSSSVGCLSATHGGPSQSARRIRAVLSRRRRRTVHMPQCRSLQAAVAAGAAMSFLAALLPLVSGRSIVPTAAKIKQKTKTNKSRPPLPRPPQPSRQH